MTLTLTIHLPTGVSRQVELTRNSYGLGREADNDIALPAEVVSRKHARLEKRPDGWWYVDLGSKNGTFHDGEQIQQIKLRDGMQLQIGQRQGKSVGLNFQLAEESFSQKPAIGMETVLEKPEPTTGYVRLQREAPARAGRQVIGRGKEADIQLSAPVISRRHASIQPGTSEWSITDLGSKNGTFLNGRRISRAEQLKAGDVIQIGPFRLNYEGRGKLNQYAASRGLRIDGRALTWIPKEDIFKQIKAWVSGKKETKIILNDINISCYPGEFIALVGGSGAGKSSLMKALSGLQPCEGKVVVEGDNLYRNYDAYRAMIGYVPQDDILHTDLKVQEALEYSARLRLPPDTEEVEIRSRVRDAIEQVELTAQRDQPISKLSGGQRKRASIAVELLADPPLFFLDEPTSGLDPGLEKKVMQILRKLADKGKTIVLVTHATANIEECHQIAFLSQGRLVYYGLPQKACEFFETGKKNDYAEIYDKISDADPKRAKAIAENWEIKFRASQFFKKILERFKTVTGSKHSADKSRAAGRFSLYASIRQFGLLAMRYFSLIRRDTILLTILLGVMPLLGALILFLADTNWLTGDPLAIVSSQLASEMVNGGNSASYFIVGSAQKLLFIMALTAVMLGLFSSSYEIVKERPIYMRERMVFVQLIPYLASKVVPLGIFAAIQSFLFLLVIGLKVIFPSSGVFLPAALEMYITLFLAVLAAISLGLFISALAPNQNVVTYIILGVLFMQIAFAGVIFDANTLSYTTLTRWTMQAFGASADLEGLDKLSLTRFQPDPISQRVSVEVEKPDPDWKCVTVETEMTQVPGCQSPIAMPSVVENELVTVMETVEQTVTIDNPDPVEIQTPYGFTLNYERSFLNLIGNWTMLLGLVLLFFAGTLAALRWHDIT